ncbi:MAG: hypothetical protein M1837_007209 [Sclerophora amabilis]|nr:MAG: hypothetical protein M1837_007209 [Sclerophora amabilis]
MGDPDLDQIRKARLEQLQQQQQQSSGGGQGSEEGGQDEQKKQQEAEARSHILSQILQPSAADRLGRIRLVKESRATDIENRLIMLARTGQLRQKLTEEQLKDMLGAVAEREREEGKDAGGFGKIVVNRRKGGWDDEDDDLEGLGS